jgi:DNA-binding transcriptional LysR family regulator
MAWDSLRLFLALTESGSVARAAKRLKVSQATISRHVRELEESVGATLFERSDTGYVLTAAGARLRDRLAEIPSQVRAALQGLAAEGSGSGGVVRVMLPCMLAPLVARGFEPVARRHPGLVLDFVSPRTITSPKARDVDIVLSCYDAPVPGFIAEGSVAIPFGLFASADYLNTHPPIATAEDLTHHTIIDFDVAAVIGAAPRWWQDRGYLRRRVVLRSTCPLSSLEAAVSGLGVVLLPLGFAARYSNLARVLPQEHIDDLKLLLLVAAGLQRDARLVVVRDFMESALRDTRGGRTVRVAAA